MQGDHLLGCNYQWEPRWGNIDSLWTTESWMFNQLTRSQSSPQLFLELFCWFSGWVSIQPTERYSLFAGVSIQPTRSYSHFSQKTDQKTESPVMTRVIPTAKKTDCSSSSSLFADQKTDRALASRRMAACTYGALPIATCTGGLKDSVRGAGAGSGSLCAGPWLLGHMLHVCFRFSG